MSFSEVFGGQTVSPAQLTYLDLSISANVELEWPLIAQPDGNVVADIIDVTASVAGLEVQMPDAQNGANGVAVLFNNVGAETFTVVDNLGGVIIALASGEAWFVYLRDNSTQDGSWRSFEFGAGTSSASAASLAGAGLKAITTTLNTQITPESTAVTPTTLVDGDRAKAKRWTGGVGTFNLPDPTVVGSDWYVIIRNDGSGDLTVTPPSGTIDGSATKTFSPGNAAIVLTDGTDFFTVGFGQSLSNIFDFTAINVAGTGDYTLSGTELDRVSYRLTGVLTGNRNIIVPVRIQQYWVDNQTSGAFTLTVKTAAGTGIEIPQGHSRIVYCDGINVIAAEDGKIPQPVTEGGTGLITVIQGDILYASAADTIARLSKNTNASRYLSNQGASNNPAWEQVSLSNGVTGRLPYVNLVQGSALSVLGVTGNAAADLASIAAGSDKQVLRREGTAVAFGAVDLAAAASVTGILPVPRGGTGFGAYVQGDILYASAANTIARLAKDTGSVKALFNTGSNNNPEWIFPRHHQATTDADQTFALDDAWKIQSHTGAPTQTYTIPTNATVAFPIGTIIPVDNRLGAGALTIAPAGGVTLDGHGQTGSLILPPGYKALLWKVGTDTWAVFTDAPHSAGSGTLFSGHVPSAGTGSTLPSGWSAGATGNEYTVTHNLGTVEYDVVLTAYHDGIKPIDNMFAASLISKGTNTFVYRTYYSEDATTAGLVTDTDFHLRIR